jgi:hypothetical protein
MKKQHADKMADLCHREEEAKKQVNIISLNNSISIYLRLQLGNKCIENGWQRWNEELIIYK